MLGPVFKGLLVFAAVGRLSKIVRNLDLLREEKEKDERKALDEYLENHRNPSQNPSPKALDGVENVVERGVIPARRRSSLEKRKLNGLFETLPPSSEDQQHNRASFTRTTLSDTVATAPGTTVLDDSDQDRSSPEQARTGKIPKKIDAYHRKQGGLSLSPSNKKFRRKGAKRSKLKHSGRRRSFEREPDDRYMQYDEYEGEGAEAGAAPVVHHKELQRDSRESSPPYARENSPEVVKIKVDLIESLKGNLESLKLNLRDSVELDEEISKDQDQSSELSFSMLGKERDDNVDYAPNAKPLVYNRREREREREREIEKTVGSSSRSYPQEHSHLEYESHRQHLENGIRPADARSQNQRRSSSSPAYNTAKTGAYTIPDSASELDSTGQFEQEQEGDVQALEGTSPPAYFVHENQVLPVGEAFRKKKQKLLNVSQDSPEWFQSKYKNRDRDDSDDPSHVGDGRRGEEGEFIGGKTQGRGKKKNSESPQNEFFSKGGKQKVECRYVTQVSDCSPDWFRSKYSKTRYQPSVRPVDQSKAKEGGSGASSTSTKSIRRLNFPEDRYF